MSYQVLARKWRPQNFQDVIGQAPILRMLVNALNQNRIHHAYLFTGTRGVGKTTLARILAKCLNCEVAVSAEPCGTCASCQAIDTGRFVDLFEIDAASRTKVEDTRELLENVPYPPAQGRYKVYLIDETHMLSGHSFNALLKTLEEPPEHVVFILATTEPKRLPITVISRCLQFHLKAISPEQLTQRLAKICTAEAIAYELPALEKIARAANGSVRDALSLLDQAIAYGGGKLVGPEVAEMLGSIPQQELEDLLIALAEQNGDHLVQAIAKLSAQAVDFQQALEELLILLHQIALAQVIKSTEANYIQTLAERFSPEDVQLFYQMAILGRRDLPLAPSPLLGFEMTMLRMLAFSADNERKQIIPAASEPKKIQQAKLETPTTSVITHTSTEQWPNLLSSLNLSGMALALASNCTLEKMTEHKIHLALSASHEPMRNPKLVERIEQALREHFQRPINLEIRTTKDELETPHKQQKRTQAHKQSAAEQTVQSDPFIQNMVDLFDGSIIKDSIQVVEDTN